MLALRRDLLPPAYIDAAGHRTSWNLEWLIGAVASAALVVGAMLVMVDGWHRVAGDVLLAIGAPATFATVIAAFGDRARDGQRRVAPNAQARADGGRALPRRTTRRWRMTCHASS